MLFSGLKLKEHIFFIHLMLMKIQMATYITAAAYGRLFDTDWNGPFTESPPQLTKWELNTNLVELHQLSWMIEL